MRALLSLAPLALAAPALAQDKPDAQVEWLEPTCDQGSIKAAVKARASSLCGIAKPERTYFQVAPSTSPLGCRVWVHGWCPHGGPGYQPPGLVVLPTLFQDAEFKGLQLVLDAGEWNLLDLPQREGGDWGKKAGSIKVPQGFTLRLCTEAGGRGRCSDFTADVYRLSETYVGNDAAVWAQVARGALAPAAACPRVFEHDGFGGKVLEVCEDVPDLRGGPWNDMISSIMVPAGWSVELCAEPGGGGACRIFGADERALSGTVVGADKTSSIRIVARPR